MNWSQENCLINDHCLTCERQEGDYATPRHSFTLMMFFQGLFPPFEARVLFDLRFFLSTFSAFFFPRLRGRDDSFPRGPEQSQSNFTG